MNCVVWYVMEIDMPVFCCLWKRMLSTFLASSYKGLTGFQCFHFPEQFLLIKNELHCSRLNICKVACVPISLSVPVIGSTTCISVVYGAVLYVWCPQTFKLYFELSQPKIKLVSCRLRCPGETFNSNVLIFTKCWMAVLTVPFLGLCCNAVL